MASVGGGTLVDLQAALTAFGLTMDDVGEVLGLIEPALGDRSEEIGNMLSMIEGSLGRRGALPNPEAPLI